ncbi:MAG TPA: hypothetical protein VLZ12_02055 [Verrucomicrobiae bacterium]|nr:hypothetical protein [Verrucomicrobiae bacterium]
MDHYEYYAFGKDRYNAGCSFQPANKYTGQIKDDETVKGVDSLHLTH